MGEGGKDYGKRKGERKENNGLSQEEIHKSTKQKHQYQIK